VHGSKFETRQRGREEREGRERKGGKEGALLLKCKNMATCHACSGKGLFLKTVQKFLSHLCHYYFIS
jgi:predicted methyltransferase